MTDHIDGKFGAEELLPRGEVGGEEIRQNRRQERGSDGCDYCDADDQSNGADDGPDGIIG